MSNRRLVLILLVAGGLLASCNGDDNPTVSSVAVNQIKNSTCNTSTPSDINSANISSGDEDQVDVTNLTPGCNFLGG
jgi:hypothetical protein